MYERGEREPGLETLEAIADFFNIDLAFLLGKSDCRNAYQLTQSQSTYDITPPEYEMVCAYRVADDDTKSIMDTALKRYKKPPTFKDAGDDVLTYQAVAGRREQRSQSSVEGRRRCRVTAQVHGRYVMQIDWSTCLSAGLV